MEATIHCFCNSAYNWVTDKIETPYYFLGGGTKQTYVIHFSPVFGEAYYTEGFGDLSFKYKACGGWQSNVNAIRTLRRLVQKGLEIAFVELIPTNPNRIQRAIHCRKRYARYAKAGKVVKSGNIQTIA